MTDLTRLPRYATMLAEHSRAVCAADTQADVHGVAPGTYPEDVTPIEAIVFPWVDRMVSAQIVQNAVTAQREGYDAVAISCFFDPGLREARSLVDIPVVSLCETSLSIGSVMGGRFGLIGLGSEQVFVLNELVARYGASGRVVATLPMDPAVTEDDLEAYHAGRGDLVERVEAVARQAINMGADLIIPAEGVLNTALVRHGATMIAGVPLMDAYGVLLNYAELLVQLQRRSAFTTSHRGYYAGPDTRGIEHFTKATIDALDQKGSRP